MRPQTAAVQELVPQRARGEGGGGDSGDGDGGGGDGGGVAAYYSPARKPRRSRRRLATTTVHAQKRHCYNDSTRGSATVAMYYSLTRKPRRPRRLAMYNSALGVCCTITVYAYARAAFAVYYSHTRTLP